MILKNEEGKLTFIVDTLCSIGLEHRGGSFAVHKLAYEIASRGHNVYVFNDPFYPHENISVIPTTKFSCTLFMEPASHILLNLSSNG